MNSRRQRSTPARSSRPLQGIYLRLARPADLPPLAAFCQRNREADLPGERPLAELDALLRGHADTVIVAIQQDAIVGVALCGVAHGRARLLELIVRSGPTCARIERRLLRRTLRNLRKLGLGTLHFGGGEAPVQPGGAPHAATSAEPERRAAREVN